MSEHEHNHTKEHEHTHHEFKGQGKEFKHLHWPKRLSNESFEKYKARRKHSAEVVHQMSKGKLIWNSAQLGSYIKSKPDEHLESNV
jgi:hypothetical protein